MLDKFYRHKTTEDEGIELLYKGINIDSIEFPAEEFSSKYNKFAEDVDVKKLQIHNAVDFDRINTYIIPQHYKDLNVEEYVRGLVPHEPETTARVEEELALYKARNLYPVLQILIYIIDTMRKNNLVWGVGRGSSVASYILYLIGVHKIDSIKYNLDITEFLKEE